MYNDIVNVVKMSVSYTCLNVSDMDTVQVVRSRFKYAKSVISKRNI